MNKQSQAIANITQTVAETEEVGLNITQQLGSNREKIGMVHGKVLTILLAAYINSNHVSSR